MLFEKTLFGDIDKVEYAIQHIKENEPPEGYYVAFSGGKDSQVIYDLVKRAGVKADFHHSITNVEPPELIWFIKQNYPDVQFEPVNKTMWQLIVEKGIPPTRLARYCCQELKEVGGEGRYCITGVRHAESYKRSKRRMIEQCYRDDKKKFLNPIIYWDDNEVWEYIHTYIHTYCSLYDKGWKRVGCLFCPYSGSEKMKRDAEAYPKYKHIYIRTFNKMIEKRIQDGKKTTWKNGEDCFNWWIGAVDNLDNENTEPTLLS